MTSSSALAGTRPSAPALDAFPFHRQHSWRVSHQLNKRYCVFDRTKAVADPDANVGNIGKDTALSVWVQSVRLSNARRL
ncbi:MAG: hypothetical protein DMG57_35595 [Acidobacteria bacterium]|nr:MAG: hypothetical protein DMG57_35595 [Acidobacteriota bacterium]